MLDQSRSRARLPFLDATAFGAARLFWVQRSPPVTSGPATLVAAGAVWGLRTGRRPKASRARRAKMATRPGGRWVSRVSRVANRAVASAAARAQAAWWAVRGACLVRRRSRQSQVAAVSRARARMGRLVVVDLMVAATVVGVARG